MFKAKKPNGRRISLVTASAASVLLAITACGSAAPSTSAPLSDVDAGCEKAYPAKYQWYDGNVINIQAAVAKDKGFFAKNCIAGSPVSIATTPASITAMVGGQVDFINTGPDNVPPARAQGIDLKVVTNILTRPIYSLVVLKDKVGDTYEETLQNIKTVGVVALGGSAEFHSHTHFSDAGIDPGTKTFVALGQTSTMLAGLENKKVDAVYFYGTAQDVAVAKEFGVMVSDTRKENTKENPVPKTLQGVGKTSLLWAAQGSFLEKNPETGKRFHAAMDEASKWIQDPKNREELYELLREQVSVPADLANADEVYKASVDIYTENVDTNVDLNALQAYVDFTVKTRGIKITEQAKDMVWSETVK